MKIREDTYIQFLIPFLVLTKLLMYPSNNLFNGHPGLHLLIS